MSVLYLQLKGEAYSFTLHNCSIRFLKGSNSKPCILVATVVIYPIQITSEGTESKGWKQCERQRRKEAQERHCVRKYI